MSRFFSRRHASLTPYTPGEQPRAGDFIKLNTNEAPYPPSPAVSEALASGVAGRLNLYPDPAGTALRSKLADYHGANARNIALGNGSDETLAFIFLAFFDGERGVVFPDVTYGLYPVLASLYGVPYSEIPVDGTLAVRAEDYCGARENVVLANPNAQTGIALPTSDIERIAASNRERVIVVDEAYADFAGLTAVPLTQKHDNLIVVRTYSKSRFMAGARLSYAVGHEDLIADLETIRCSFNPYNVNSVTLEAGAAAIDSGEYYKRHWELITDARRRCSETLRTLGFELTDSRANFLFTRHPKVPGRTLFDRLRGAGVLTRRFDRPERIADWLRITVGTGAQMETLAGLMKEIVLTEGGYDA
ncbi:MAG: aminotransferase class I/II-fold pyridoxal phosphate-dependent enzyme [Oscillospiraceae bacterium]|nr:aminotransferase class I/II-fold pyridoxal phosphate-dependent enzyme [Oscillospiraceae bacterium]